jgi:hypothetical protein
MTTGTIVKVTLFDSVECSTVTYWLVATGDPGVALKAVRRSTPAGWIPDVQGPAPAELVERYGLAPGYACPLPGRGSHEPA